MPPTRLARAVAPDDNVPVCEQAAALDRQTDAFERVAGQYLEESKAWRELLKPAIDFIHGLGERLDALCKWFKGAWPWLGIIGVYAIGRAVNMSPDDIAKIVGMLGGHQ